MAKYLEDYACAHCAGSSGLCSKCKASLLAQGIEHKPAAVANPQVLKKQPCGECHIMADETCDLCGAKGAEASPPGGKAMIYGMPVVMVAPKKPATLKEASSKAMESLLKHEGGTIKMLDGDPAPKHWLAIEELSSAGKGMPAGVLTKLYGLGHMSTGKSMLTTSMIAKAALSSDAEAKPTYTFKSLKNREKVKELPKYVLDHAIQSKGVEEGMNAIAKAVAQLVEDNATITYDSVMEKVDPCWGFDNAVNSGSITGKASKKGPNMQTIPKTKTMTANVDLSKYVDDAAGMMIVGNGQCQTFTPDDDKPPAPDAVAPAWIDGTWSNERLSAEAAIIMEDETIGMPWRVRAAAIIAAHDKTGAFSFENARWLQWIARWFALRDGVPDFTQ